MKNIFNYHPVQLRDFEKAMEQYGWVIYENVLSLEFMEEISNSLKDAHIVRRQIQRENGIGADTTGTLHHLLEPWNFGLNFIRAMYCDEQIRHFLKGNYILNSFNGVINTKKNKSSILEIQRGIRSFTGSLKLMVQMIVLLDDFTADNGAPYFLSGSHKTELKPNEIKFFSHADRALAKRGSIILFDSRLWHAAGRNFTNLPSRTLTLSFTVPYFKQQLDYPRFLGYEFGEKLSEQVRQVIGYNARVPANLYEFYQPAHRRMYKHGQG